MDMNEATSKAIGAERGIAGMTVRDLASASGIPERSLMRVLQAERDIKVNQVAQIAAALGIYPHELIETAEQLLAREQRGRATLITMATEPAPSEPPAETVTRSGRAVRRVLPPQGTREPSAEPDRPDRGR